MTAHGEPLAPECREVLAPRDEGDVVPADREPHAEVAADGAGAVHENAHGAGGYTRATRVVTAMATMSTEPIAKAIVRWGCISLM